MRRFVIILVAFFLVTKVLCQDVADRKKVAVVLSGGGAKGMAHIGALKVIERAGIPVDIVCGTSMGSIVGGLYAIGYNADVLDSIVRNQDWSYVITDKEDLAQQSLADREKQNTYVISRGLTIGKRNENDGGIIKGKNLAELFWKLCTGYTDSIDFSHDLPIPFACVATDIVDNTEYDFHSGCLPQAMRASMAIPAVFSPVRKGDHVLVDGGLRNNYPADIAREMGADIIIGVTVQGAPRTAEDLGGTMSILSQIVDVNCKNKYDENLAMTDVPIRVNTTGYGAASFSANAIDTLIRRGEEEAMKHWDELMTLKDQIGIDKTYAPPRLTLLRPAVMSEKIKIIAYEFENMTQQDERFLREKFQLKEGDSIDVRKQEQITTAMRMDLFYQNAKSRTVPNGDGYQLILTAGNRKTSQVNAGFRFDTEEYAAVQLGADFPLKTSLPMNAEFTLRLGKRMMGRAELTFHPRSFTRPAISYSFHRNDVNIYYKGDRDYSVVYNQHQAEFSPVNLNVRNFNVRMSIRWDYLHYQDKLVADAINSQELLLENSSYISYRAQIKYNSENSWHFPTRGARFKAEYAYLTDNFTKLEGKPGMSDVNANWRMSFALSEHFTVQPMVYGRLLFGSIVPVVFANVMGGEWFGHYLEQQMPFAGVGYVEYTRPFVVAAQLQAQQSLGSGHYLLLRLATAQHAAVIKDIPDSKMMLGCQAAYYYNTMLGPIGVTLGYSNKTKEPYFYINLGYEF
ncbi:NTE family protein [Prevotella aff. ruminicola Tc2-24]|uniref:NTE family protein n=1 Tax=Prevotella aff. ruminicola Tc2-24 TaxID=81582 RepID=A0A1I0M5P2_9BACT|nr:patatin-like phospholipase family protein [Prevotella aff. ruminicola Tc2-24]SEV83264.1 NTE family protein [Prevotella aff. ruminicola Tc2-24]